MEKAVQASANPTVKLTSAIWAAMIMSVSAMAMRNLAPQWYDPDVWQTLSPFVVAAAGYFVHDAPNVVVVQK